MDVPPLPDGFELEGGDTAVPPLPEGFQLEGESTGKSKEDEKSYLGTIGAGIKSAGAGAIGTISELIDPTALWGEDVQNPAIPDLDPTKRAAAQVVDKQRAQYKDGLAGQALGAVTEVAANPLNYVGGRGAEVAKTGAGFARDLLGSAVTGLTSGAIQGVGTDDSRGTNAVVGGIVGPVAKTAERAVRGTVQAGKDIAKGIAGKSAEAWQEVGDALKSKSQATFKQMTDSGQVIGKKQVNAIVGKLENALASDGKLNADLHRNTISVLGDIQARRGSTLTFEEAQQYRQLLGDVVQKGTDITGKVDSDARKALILIDKLDEGVEALGGTGELAKQARQEWGQYRRFDKIRTLIDRYGDKPGVLKNQVNLLLSNGKAMRGYSEEEKVALRRLAGKGGAEGWLRLYGRLGFDPSNPSANIFLPVVGAGIGTAIDGVATGGLVTAGATAARYGSQSIVKGQANDALGVLSGLSKPVMKADPFTAPRDAVATAVQGASAVSRNRNEARPVEPANDNQPQPAAKPAVSDTVVDRIIGIESGGRANAKNPNSSALGPGQFIKSTWLGLMKDEPEAKGLSDRQILALRTDGAWNRRMVAKYAAKNTDVLAKRGVLATDGLIYLSHFLDGPIAAKVAKADPNTPVAKLVGMAAVKANPKILKGKRAGEVIAWAQRKTNA
ncbi:hypothetical protein GFL93_09415 [Rhizobium leguminosarum bv. viciae]|uniref:hypothetical protein n=1 Tax=Rhizobium TaxID=379 RepID=UPI001440EA45|nr:hypothetical protein [Rhizobium leguminosarum]NKK06089.1 hypothetical protein [Rhizobium leguminosarum bv. viciae]